VLRVHAALALPPAAAVAASSCSLRVQKACRKLSDGWQRKRARLRRVLVSCWGVMVGSL
jgi:hypothetical protein